MPSPQPKRKLPQGGQRGLLRALAPITFLLIATSVQARFLEVRSKPAGKPAKKRQSLLAQRTNDPGFFRNFGVTGGIPQEDMGAFGNDGSKSDSTLDRNVWTSDSMEYDFPFLDNLQPVAPMDRVHNGAGVAYMDPVHVSEYQNPDAFPTVVGKGCMCRRATSSNEKIECDCGEHSANDHYTWLKDTPVPGTNNYTLTPADITYRAGDYWQPQHSGGIASPADKLPPDSYPNQAPSDEIWPLPASASADRIGIKYARYMDQVMARSKECDTVSEKCTVPCKPGDAVTVTTGNVQFSANVIKTFVGNAAEVEFSPMGDPSPSANPSAAPSPAPAMPAPLPVQSLAPTTDCPLAASCTSFRFCKAPYSPSPCVQMKDTHSHNWAGLLVHKYECPTGTLICKTVKQVIMATMLRKDGKACKAAPR